MLQIVIGYVVSRRVNNQEDYFLAGRSLGPLLATFSIFATWFGAESCIGSSAAVFSGGLSDTRADPFGFTLCLFLMGLVFARKLWSLNVTTIADFFRNRYGTFTEKLAVFVLIPSTLMWAAAQIRAFGQILSIVAPIDPTIGVTVAAGFVIVYTFLGGLLGDVVTDILKGTIVILGLILLMYLGIDASGGIQSALDKITPDRLSLVKADESWLVRVDTWLVPILGSIMAQELLSRVFASRSASVARKSSLMAGSMYLIVGMIPVSLGLIAFDLVPDLADTDQFLPMLAKQLLHPALFVIFVGALVSAILSTVDSTLLSTSAFISHNIFGERYRKMDTKSQLQFSRYTIIFGGIVSYFLALGSESVYDLVVMASAFGAAGTVTITCFGLWFPKLGGQLASIPVLLVGLISHPIYEYVFKVDAPFFMSVISSVFVYLVFSSKIIEAKILKVKTQ